MLLLLYLISSDLNLIENRGNVITFHHLWALLSCELKNNASPPSPLSNTKNGAGERKIPYFLTT